MCDTYEGGNIEKGGGGGGVGCVVEGRGALGVVEGLSAIT